MWQRFTERARRAVYLAQDEAVRRGTSEIDSEHLLLGLLRNSDNVASLLLGELAVSPRELYEAVWHCLPRASGQSIAGDIRLQARARRVIDRAQDEAERLGNPLVATEHLLIALSEDEGLAGGILTLRGVTKERLHATVAKLVAGGDKPAGLRGQTLAGLARLPQEQRDALNGTTGVALDTLPETLQKALQDLLDHAVASNNNSGMPLRVSVGGTPRLLLKDTPTDEGAFRMAVTLEGVSLTIGLAPQPIPRDSGLDNLSAAFSRALNEQIESRPPEEERPVSERQITERQFSERRPEPRSEPLPERHPAREPRRADSPPIEEDFSYYVTPPAEQVDDRDRDERPLPRSIERKPYRNGYHN